MAKLGAEHKRACLHTVFVGGLVYLFACLLNSRNKLETEYNEQRHELNREVHKTLTADHENNAAASK